METYIVKLYFKNALRIGGSVSSVGIENIDSKIIHSDTLWSALCNQWAVLDKVNGVTFKEFLDSYENQKPMFKISSAFPLTRSGSEYWLPKPMSVPYAFSKSNKDEFQKNEDTEKYHKKIKNQGLLKLEQFKQWIDFHQNLDVGDISKESYSPNKIRDMVRPHNTLDRVSMNASIYHSGNTYIELNQSGYYFLVQMEEEHKTHLDTILKMLQNTAGIGGNRNTGVGEIASCEIIGFDKTGIHQNNWNSLGIGKENEAYNAHCLISIFHPTDEEQLQTIENVVAYKLLLRKGWTGSRSTSLVVKRQTVNMFSEGSVFTYKPEGHLVDLTPTTIPYPHPVYRYGYALTVPIKIDLED